MTAARNARYLRSMQDMSVEAGVYAVAQELNDLATRIAALRSLVSINGGNSPELDQEISAMGSERQKLFVQVMKLSGHLGGREALVKAIAAEVSPRHGRP